MRKMFSKNQIRELAREVLATDDPVDINGDLNLGGDLAVDGDLNVDGDITANIVEIRAPEYSENFIQKIRDSANYSTYMDSDTLYTSFKVINGVLWTVISGKFKSKAYGGNISFRFTPENEFITKYYSKIFRANGTPLSQVSPYGDYIACVSASATINGTIRTHNAVLFSGDGNNSLNLVLYNVPLMTAGADQYIDIRLPLVLV